MTAAQLIARINELENAIGRPVRKHVGTSKQSLKIILSKLEREAKPTEKEVFEDFLDNNKEKVDKALKRRMKKTEQKVKKPTNELTTYAAKHNLNPKVLRAKLRSKGFSAPYSLADIKKALATK